MSQDVIASHPTISRDHSDASPAGVELPLSRRQLSQYAFLKGLSMLPREIHEDLVMSFDDLHQFFLDYFDLPCDYLSKIMLGFSFHSGIENGQIPLRVMWTHQGQGVCIGIDRGSLERSFTR